MGDVDMHESSSDDEVNNEKLKKRMQGVNKK